MKYIYTLSGAHYYLEETIKINVNIDGHCRDHIFEYNNYLQKIIQYDLRVY